MPPPLLTLQDIRVGFGTKPLLDGAELFVSAGDRLCLVGRNGCGKSTLLKVAAGAVVPDSGERFLRPGVTLRYLAQEPDLSAFSTTLAAAQVGVGPGESPHRARTMLNQLGLSGEESPAHLSGGEARRVALAQVLAPAPDILLLDEPTNHLDLPTIEFLEREFAAMRSAVVIVSHDRRFLENLSRATVWLNDGTTYRLNKGFADFEPWRDDFLEHRKIEQHKLKRKIAAEASWLNKGVTARRRRNMGRLRALMELRKKQKEQRAEHGNLSMTVSEAEISGKLVLEAKNIRKSFTGPVLVEDFSLRVQRGSRVGIVGPNGTGKTTLLNLMTGALAPDSGSLRHVHNLQMVTLDQKREQLNTHDTLQDALTGGSETIMVNGQKRHVTGYMKDFLFMPEQARTPVGVLSGGERGRLMLAIALARTSNLLVLDEPTNDLDLETLDLLQETLADYDGTVLLVSHDRDFLDRIATSIIAWGGGGKWIEYAGGYSDMMHQRVGLPPEATKTRKAKRRAEDHKSRPATKSGNKLSYKDKYALEQLPRKIAALESEIEALNKILTDNDFFARDPESFKTAAQELQKAKTALATAEDQWLELELALENSETD